MNVYLDESGDLGFSFDKPYRHGGSSRYLTTTILLVPKSLSHHPKRVVKAIYGKSGKRPDREIKATELSETSLATFISDVIKLRKRYPQIEIISITVNKQNVENHIRGDPNKLYNYMISLILPNKIKNMGRVTFIPDKRSIKVTSGNSLSDYLQIKLWFEYGSKVTIECTPLESHTSLNLLFTDWISHIIWQHYEDGETTLFNVLKPHIGLSSLFF